MIKQRITKRDYKMGDPLLLGQLIEAMVETKVK
jgi:hypothetical protein